MNSYTVKKVTDFGLWLGTRKWLTFFYSVSGVVQGGVPGEPVQRNQGDGGVCGGIRLQAALQVLPHVHCPEYSISI
jgi:hypothetical protein